MGKHPIRNFFAFIIKSSLPNEINKQRLLSSLNGSIGAWLARLSQSNNSRDCIVLGFCFLGVFLDRNEVDLRLACF